MQINKFFGIDGSKQAKGTTIIIDIFRAATVAAFLLDKGIKEIIPVATKEEAFKHKKENPAYILVGEELGYKIQDFDFGNSPFEISKTDNLKGKTAIHRSSMGTQGIVKAKNAKEIIFGSFVVTSAILKYLNQNKHQDISIIAMDGEGTEDDIFADYLIAKLKNIKSEEIKNIVNYLKTHPGAARFLDPDIPEFPEEDFYLCLDLDRFNFVPLVVDNKIVKRCV